MCVYASACSVPSVIRNDPRAQRRLAFRLFKRRRVYDDGMGKGESERLLLSVLYVCGGCGEV